MENNQPVDFYSFAKLFSQKASTRIWIRRPFIVWFTSLKSGSTVWFYKCTVLIGIKWICNWSSSRAFLINSVKNDLRFFSGCIYPFEPHLRAARNSLQSKYYRAVLSCKKVFFNASTLNISSMFLDCVLDAPPFFRTCIQVHKCVVCI